MKPFQSILPLLLVAPAVLPLVGAVASNPSVLRDPSDSALLVEGFPESPESQLPSSPSGSTSLRSGAGPAFDRQPDRMLDPLERSRAGALLALDPTASRRSAPVNPPPPVASSAVVRFGDTLLKISQRYGLSIAELLRLNPGLDTARLVAGSQIQVAHSAPGSSRMLLGLAPVGSGGLSWPELPQFGEGREGRRSLPGRGNAAMAWPAEGTFTSGYGWRWGRMHKGIDIANNVGTPIVAAARGRVTFAGWHDGGYGYLVEITHDDGTLTRYGHNSRLLVRQGESVDQGQVISQMGSTGRSTGPHLHFEILPPGEGAMNPLLFLPPRA